MWLDPIVVSGGRLGLQSAELAIAVRAGCLVCAERRQTGPPDPVDAGASGAAHCGVALSPFRADDHVCRKTTRVGGNHPGFPAQCLPCQREGESGALPGAAPPRHGLPLYAGGTERLARISVADPAAA